MAKKKIDQERKIQQVCMKKQLVLLTRGESIPPELGTRFIPRPCALAGSDGLPHKGNKSKATDFFSTHYKQAEVVVNHFPDSWIPDCVVLEGMFLIMADPPLHQVLQPFRTTLTTYYIGLYSHICKQVQLRCIFFLMTLRACQNLLKKLRD